jgi:D-glycero-D-manno-heptose 1,7-bisphosphate phosphatase
MNGRAVFLDRDGVLNDNVYYADSGEWESPRVAEDFVLKPGVVPALKILLQLNFHLFLVSNQPSYAKGKTSKRSLAEVHMRLDHCLGFEGIRFTEAFYCFHHPKGVLPELAISCSCRKPSAYFLNRAARDYDLDLEQSWMIGDRDVDIECGQRAGVHTIQIASDHPTTKAGQVVPHFCASGILEAAEIVRDHSGART